MIDKTQEELEKIVIDLERTFEGFRTTPPNTYQSATPTVSKMAADQFIRRITHYINKNYVGVGEVEDRVRSARIDELEKAIEDYNLEEFNDDIETYIRARIDELEGILTKGEKV